MANSPHSAIDLKAVTNRKPFSRSPHWLLALSSLWMLQDESGFKIYFQFYEFLNVGANFPINFSIYIEVCECLFILLIELDAC